MCLSVFGCLTTLHIIVVRVCEAEAGNLSAAVSLPANVCLALSRSLFLAVNLQIISSVSLVLSLHMHIQLYMYIYAYICIHTCTYTSIALSLSLSSSHLVVLTFFSLAVSLSIYLSISLSLSFYLSLPSAFSSPIFRSFSTCTHICKTMPLSENACLQTHAAVAVDAFLQGH